MIKPSNDSNLIMNLAAKTGQSETRKIEKTLSSTSWINLIIDFLKKHDGICIYDDLIREFKDLDNFIKTHSDFFEILKNSNKVIYDPKLKTFQIKTKYEIKKLEDLKELIKSSKYGLPEDSELIDSYPGIKKDLEDLKRINFVKVVPNDEKKLNVLFYRDCNDKIEKMIVHPDNQQALQELRKIWKEELNYFTDEQISYNKKRHRTENDLIGKKRKRKAKLVVNTHLLPDLADPGIKEKEKN